MVSSVSSSSCRAARPSSLVQPALSRRDAQRVGLAVTEDGVVVLLLRLRGDRRRVLALQDVEVGIGDLDPVFAEGLEHAEVHVRDGLLGVGVPGDPDGRAQHQLAGPVVQEVHGAGILLDPVGLNAQREGALCDAVPDDLHGLRHVGVVADRKAQMDAPPVGHPVAGVRHDLGVQLAVGDDEPEAVVEPKDRMAQRDVLDDARFLPHDDPVADLEGPLKADQQAADHIVDDRLGCEAHHRHDQRGAAQQDGIQTHVRVKRPVDPSHAGEEDHHAGDAQKILPVQAGAIVLLPSQIRDRRQRGQSGNDQENDFQCHVGSSSADRRRKIGYYSKSVNDYTKTVCDLQQKPYGGGPILTIFLSRSRSLFPQGSSPVL